MIGKIVTALAGRTIARTVGGAAAGPAGALIGAAVPLILPRAARALGPFGMLAAAVGGLLFTRWMDRRAERKAAETAGLASPKPKAGSLPPRAPQAVLGSPTPPDALEGELLKD
jgi:uncharacterized protein YqgC (DUF456 family)